MTVTAEPPTPAAVHGRAAGENFAVAARLLPGPVRRDLLAIYGYARLVDDLGDEVAGDRNAALDAVAADLDRVFGGQPPAHPLLRDLVATVRAHDLPREPFDRLLAANRRDQVQRSYATFDELVDYCRSSADPVGELVLRVAHAATPWRLERSSRICTALQVIEHCQDVAEDRRRGRTYLPAEDLERFRCSEDDLARIPTPTRVRGLVAFELARAEELLDAGAPLVGSLRGWVRLAVAGYVAGGRAAIAALRRDRYGRLDGSARPGRVVRGGATLRAFVAGR